MFDYLFFFNFETSQKFEGALGFIMSIKEHKPENISPADFVDGITRLAEFKVADFDIYQDTEIVDQFGGNVSSLNITIDDLIAEIMDYAVEHKETGSLISKIDSVPYFDQAREYLYS